MGCETKLNTSYSGPIDAIQIHSIEVSISKNSFCTLKTVEAELIITLIVAAAIIVVVVIAGGGGPRDVIIICAAGGAMDAADVTINSDAAASDVQIGALQSMV